MVTETSLHRSVAWIAFCSSMSGRTAYHGGGKCELTLGTRDENEDNAKCFISKHIRYSVCRCKTRICDYTIGPPENIYCHLGH